MTLHVAYNLLHLVPGETGGMELYARRLLPALRAADASLRITVLAAGAAARGEWDADVVAIPGNPRSRVRRVLAEQTLVPRAVRRIRPDLVHNAFNTAPAVAGRPQVTSIQDLIFNRHPETHGLRARGVELLVPLAARRSRRVLTGSKASKADIVELLGVPAERVDVTPYGPGLERPAVPLPPEAVREELALGDGPLVLTVAARLPHKNIERLIDALAQVPDATLVVPGYSTGHEAGLMARAARAGVEARVRFVSWLDDAMLDALYRAADCFVLPSLAEGFGLPVLEAMLRGVPVACSNTPALVELAGDAALLFEPQDVNAIANAVRRSLTDAALRQKLRAAGKRRAATFTWQETARRTLECYARALA